jgi:shikimate dehydrogenase
VAQVGAPGSPLACDYRDLEAMGCFDLVVNATSASLTGELPPVPPTVFSPMGTAYELIYGKALMPFLRLARNAGMLGVVDGVGMLVEQAAEAFA